MPDGRSLKLMTYIADSNRSIPVVILSGQTEGRMEEALTPKSVVASMSKDELDDPTFIETVRRTIGR